MPDPTYQEREAAKLAAFRTLPGTPLNLGAAAFLAALTAPAGFIAARFEDTWPGEPSHPSVRFCDGAHIEIRIVLNGLDHTYMAGCGHTDFDGRTFDRRGVEDSFYVDHEDTVEDVDAKIAAQITRVAEARARRARSVPVPGLPGGWTVTPEVQAQQSARLNAGQAISFQPAGMGTGYTVSRRQRNRWATALPPATSAFYGVVGKLYAERLDCD